MGLTSRFRMAARGAVMVLMLLSLWHCGDSTPRASMPRLLAGGWKCENVEPIEASSAPESLRRLGVTGGQSAIYEHDGRKIPVRVYELPTGTAAFEAQQTYARSAEEYYFTMGASFVIIDARALANDERRPFLMAFVEAAKPDEAEREEEPQKQE